MKKKVSGTEGGSGMEEKRQRGRGITRTVGTFALGATVGSLLALLFAPASGRVTRKRLAKRLQTWQHSATRKLGEAKRLLATKAGHVREAATERINHARDWIAEHVANGNSRRLARRRTVHHA